MGTIVVVFFKEVRHGMSEEAAAEKVEFNYGMDNRKSYYENMVAAYDVAVSKGHNPNKNIMIKEI